MVKVLVVDDEPDIPMLISCKFEEEIEKGELEFVFASNGVEALNLIETNKDIDIVFSDINMPLMDGITLLSNLNKYDQHIRTVMISAYGDMQNIRKSMNQGAFDFIVKPFDFVDLENTLSRAQVAVKQFKLAMQEHNDFLEIQKELDVARSIQSAFIPHNFEPVDKIKEKAYSAYGKMLPARVIGGDFFDFFQLGNDRVGFVIGDVSGKGISAALFMTMARAAIRCYASRTTSIAECMKAANKFLCEENELMMFVTLFFGELNLKTLEFTYCNAGHLPPYVISEGDADTIEGLGAYSSIALGVDYDHEFPVQSINLNKGQSIILYTDGVTEAMNNMKEFYGAKRFEELAKKLSNLPPQELVESLIKDIIKFAGSQEQFDDIALVCIKIES